MKSLTEIFSGPPRPTLPPEEQSCSFCGLPQKRVEVMISGPEGATICERCVELCSEIVTEKRRGRI